MHFLVNINTHEDGSYRYVVEAGSEYRAECKAIRHFQDEGNDGSDVESYQAEMFNTFEHGDIRDYEILT